MPGRKSDEIERIRRLEASRGKKNPHAGDQKALKNSIVRAEENLDETEFEQFLIALGRQRGTGGFEAAMQAYRDFREKS